MSRPLSGFGSCRSVSGSGVGDSGGSSVSGSPLDPSGTSVRLGAGVARRLGPYALPPPGAPSPRARPLPFFATPAPHPCTTTDPLPASPALGPRPSSPLRYLSRLDPASPGRSTAGAPVRTISREARRPWACRGHRAPSRERRRGRARISVGIGLRPLSTSPTA